MSCTVIYIIIVQLITYPNCTSYGEPLLFKRRLLQSSITPNSVSAHPKAPSRTSCETSSY